MVRGDQQTRQTTHEASHSCLICECVKPSTLDFQEHHRIEGQMGDGMFPCVKIERKTAPNKFVAAHAEQIRDLGEKTRPSKTNEGIHRCVTLKSGGVVKHIRDA